MQILGCYKGLATLGVGHLCSYVYSRKGIVSFEREVPTSACRGILAATNLLGKPLKSFIVNHADLPKKGVKRLAISDERVNHGSRVKMYNLCRV